MNIDAIANSVRQKADKATSQMRGNPVVQGISQAGGAVGEVALGGAYRTMQDIVAGMIANMTDPIRQKAAQDAFALARSIEEQATNEMDPPKRRQLLLQANTIYDNISRNAQSVADTFSDDVTQNPFLRGLEAGSEIAGAAAIGANPMATMKGIAEPLKHPMQAGQSVIDALKHPKTAITDFVKQDFGQSFGGLLPGAEKMRMSTGMPAKMGYKTTGQVQTQNQRKTGLGLLADLDEASQNSDPAKMAKIAQTIMNQPPGSPYDMYKPQIPNYIAPHMQQAPSAPRPKMLNRDAMSKADAPIAAGAMNTISQVAGPATWQKFVEAAKKVANEMGYPVSVILGQAALETGRVSSPGNNYFGIKGSGTAGTQNLATKEATSGGQFYDTRSNFAAYNSPEDSIRAYVDLIQRRYPQAWEQRNNPEAMVKAIKAGGYATDPNYVAKVMSTPEFRQNLAPAAPAQPARPVLPAQQKTAPAKAATKPAPAPKAVIKPATKPTPAPAPKKPPAQKSAPQPNLVKNLLNIFGVKV